MTKRIRRKPSVIVATPNFIDPADCNSTVSYKIINGRRGYVWGSVVLSDCNRSIEWYFSAGTSRGGSTEKIDNAIQALQAFREAWADANKPKPRKRKKA